PARRRFMGGQAACPALAARREAMAERSLPHPLRGRGRGERALALRLPGRGKPARHAGSAGRRGLHRLLPGRQVPLPPCGAGSGRTAAGSGNGSMTGIVAETVSCPEGEGYALFFHDGAAVNRCVAVASEDGRLSCACVSAPEGAPFDAAAVLVE